MILIFILVFLKYNKSKIQIKRGIKPRLIRRTLFSLNYIYKGWYNNR
jgi:hypothetical protein